MEVEVCRTTLRFVESLREKGYDVWTISLWESWLARMPDLEAAIQRIEAAFDGVALGDGLGLREADAIDSYASDAELAAQRKLDEKNDRRKIPAPSLSDYYCAPAFFDARGFHFHLPAFLIASLEGKCDFKLLDYLGEKEARNAGWIGLLDEVQAEAIISVLELLKDYPEYYGESESIDCSIGRIRDRRMKDTG